MNEDFSFVAVIFPFQGFVVSSAQLVYSFPKNTFRLDADLVPSLDIRCNINLEP